MMRPDERHDYDPADPDPLTAGGPRRLRDDRLLHLLAVNWLIGAAVAVALTAVVLITDTAHLRSLAMASSEPWIPMLLLFLGFLITMSSVAMAAAVMMLPKDDDDDRPGGGTKLEVLTPRRPLMRFPLTPVPVRAPSRPTPRRY